MLELNKIYCMDCLEGMKQLDDNSVNLEILDLPYNIGKDIWGKIADYENWVMRVIAECERILKDNGSFYFFHSEMPAIANLMQRIKKETKFVFKQFIPWNKYFKGSKNEGFCKQRLSNPINRNYYDGFTEYILFYTFQDDTGLTTVMLDTNNFSTLRRYFKELLDFIKLNKKQMMDEIGQSADHCFRWGSSQWHLPTKETYQELIDVFGIDKWKGFRPYESLRQEYESLRYTFNNQKVMVPEFNNQHWNNNIWNYDFVNGCNEHETPKPEALIENIILHSSNEGDLVFDPTIGTGTITCMAKRHNRNFIGFEINEEYCKIAEKRLEQETFTSFLEKENRSVL